MKNKLKNFITITLFFVGILYLVCFFCFPDQTQEIIGYRFYVILTDSMEPRIPTYSLVCVQNIDDVSTLEPEDIITFHITRFGEDEILTHHFAYTEVIDQVTYYRTHPESMENLDPYDIQVEDLVGTYVFHVPYVGKVILFLTSPFGVIMLGISLMIFVLYHYAEENFDLDEEISLDHIRLNRKRHPEEYLSFEDIHIALDQDFLYVQGCLINETSVALGYIKVCFTFYDIRGNELQDYTFYASGKQKLLPKQETTFSFMVENMQDIHDYQIQIVSAKR